MWYIQIGFVPEQSTQIQLPTRQPAILISSTPSLPDTISVSASFVILSNILSDRLASWDQGFLNNNNSVILVASHVFF